MRKLSPEEYTKQYGDPAGPDCPSCALRFCEVYPALHLILKGYEIGRAHV